MELKLLTVKAKQSSCQNSLNPKLVMVNILENVFEATFR